MKNRTKFFVFALLILGIWLMWPKPTIQSEHQKYLDTKTKVK